MFAKYVERATIYDRLQGLSDTEVLNQIRDSPSKIKNRTNKLLKKLDQFGVKLDKYGKVDFSAVTNHFVLKQLEANPMVKIALMERDLDYEFPHLEIR
jgi:hypothetical protein